jgi:hypothetical protein
MAFTDLRNATRRRQPGPATGVSRREAIAAGGLAIAGAAGLTPATSPPIGIVFGADRGNGYNGFHATDPLAVGARWYFSTVNQFPPAWPNTTTHMTLSLRPEPSDLFAGKLDGQLKAVIDSAPAHSELTFWYQNTSNNPLHYPPDVNNARTSRRMQEYGLKLCQGTNVLFGVITVGPAADQVNWMAPDLDWYGDDLYEFANLRGPNNTFSKAKVTARLHQNLHAWQKVTGREAPAIRICETNSPYDSHRSAFFTTIADFLARHNGNRMLTFWNAKGGLAHGGLSGPWPPSRSVVKTLTSLTKEYNWKTLPASPGGPTSWA